VLEKWVNECDIDGFNISRESCQRITWRLRSSSMVGKVKA
jgi:hypothetical protein